jgi:hypothetical protein
VTPKADVSRANSHHDRTPAPTPIKPQVNRAFNPSLHPEVLDEAMIQSSRRY